MEMCSCVYSLRLFNPPLSHTYRSGEGVGRFGVGQTCSESRDQSLEYNIPLPSQRVRTHVAASPKVSNGIPLSRMSIPETACGYSYAK